MERLVSETERGILEKKEVVMERLEKEDRRHDKQAQKARTALQPTEALKVFFDRIPLFSVPGIDNAGVVEVTANDTIGDALKLLYKQRVLGAPVRDPHRLDSAPWTDRYVGLIDFASMVLWALEEFEDAEERAKVSGMILSPTDAPENATASLGKMMMAEQVIGGTQSTSSPADDDLEDGFFGLLNKLDSVKSTNVGALSRSFRWGPFLPVRPDDSLLHVLLLLSKHHLQAVPVVAAESEDATVKGFITQDAAVQLLLQCDGLTWFDLIAEKPLSDLGFELEHNSGTLVGVNGDDTLITAFRAMWKHRVSAMPVTDTASKHIIGTLRNTDLLILLDQPHLFNKRREILLKDFIQVETADEKSQIITQGSIEEDLGAVISTTALTLGSVSRPKMTQPVVSVPSDSLKTTMEKLVQSHSNRSFIVDDKGRLTGVITLRDIIMQFAPPLAQAPNQWGGFFESALQQTSSVL
ncbi:unnamed protein product [Sphagnum jensenii]|uniref:CBS domain-containing protein n=1 Tax=Sphagnum jensenii TaxID=128206 RepID=A0ABP0W832_9BRYO